MSTLTKEQVESIVEWAKEGLGCTEIARKLDNVVTKQRVQQILAKRGLKPHVIKQKKKEKEYHERMSAKWGDKYADKDWRRSELYAVMREKFRNKKANASSAGHTWTIEFGDLEFPEVCPVLGIELDYFADGRKENSPSFDRLDSSKGYVKGNVIIMAWRANRIKNDGTAEEHRRIYEFMKNI